jgi:uncharacterized membrane protein
MNEDPRDVPLRRDIYLARLRPGTWATVAAVAVMAALSAWAWPKIPSNAHVAVHWGLGGQANGYTGRLGALLRLPLVMLGLGALLAVLPLIDPRRPNLLRSSRAYNAIWIGLAALLTGLHAVIVLEAAGHRLPVTSLLTGATGVLFMVIGNYLPKLRSNWFAGLRTPWTLSSERSWLRSHRLAGRLFVALGLLVLLLAPFASSQVQVVTLAAGLGVVTAVTVTYSWWVWRTDPARHSLGR